jgi:hypothetical protein
VVAWGANQLGVFVVGTDRALYHKWWNGSSWVHLSPAISTRAETSLISRGSVSRSNDTPSL